jgi:hypothetical protein
MILYLVVAVVGWFLGIHIVQQYDKLTTPLSPWTAINEAIRQGICACGDKAGVEQYLLLSLVTTGGSEEVSESDMDSILLDLARKAMAEFAFTHDNRMLLVIPHGSVQIQQPGFKCHTTVWNGDPHIYSTLLHVMEQGTVDTIRSVPGPLSERSMYGLLLHRTRVTKTIPNTATGNVVAIHRVQYVPVSGAPIEE